MDETLTIPKPDDWHLHLRDGDILKAVLPDTARHFARAIVMPNLIPPVVTTADALAYKERILKALPKDADFTPLMTVYLTETSNREDIAAGYKDGIITGVKLYPAGATTNSDQGVRSIEKVMPTLERMADIGMPLLIHGEVTDPEIDIFDREKVFIESVLDRLRSDLPELKIVLEHITTKEAIAYIKSAKANLAATITPHHLIINRNHLLAQGGIRPHYYCLPIAKREPHRLALREAAISGDSRFFMGTDSAPHPDSAKLSPCGCAGIYSAPLALACIAQVFEEEDALSQLEHFVSLAGANYYGLPLNKNKITLKRKKEPYKYPPQLKAGNEMITVFDPKLDLFWQVDS